MNKPIFLNPSSNMLPSVTSFKSNTSKNPFHEVVTPTIFKQQPNTKYVCGYCSKETQIKLKDALTCSFCSHRILYKKRTQRSMYTL
jgi:DNA-directed RNA polymerase subunit RPC12/RpoP